MASRGKKPKKYKGDDKVDKWLLNQVVKHVNHDEIGSFARDLFVDKSVYSNVTKDKDRMFKVLQSWLQDLPDDYAVKDLINEIKDWIDEGYVQQTIWKRLQDYITQDVLPAFGERRTHQKSSTSPDTKKNVAPSTSGSEVLVGFQDLQQRTRISIKQTWQNYLSNDWLNPEKAKKMPLSKFYNTDLVWVKKVKGIQDTSQTMKSMYELIEVEGAGEHGMNFLVEAKPGMGKTSSLAYLGMEWVEKPDQFPFDFVFIIRLRNVDRDTSLAQVIIDQHEKLCDEDREYIDALLSRKAKQKVLLLLDGYDEYTAGTNKALDKAIESGVGKCFTVLTSRHGTDEGEKTYVSKEIREKMDGEVRINGFNEESKRRFCTEYFGSEEESKNLVAQAYEKLGNDHYKELSTPIVLRMICALYEENKSLPDTRTKIYETVRELAMDRTRLKTFGSVSSKVKDLTQQISILGKFAWEALQKDIRQLLLNKDELEKECPDIMKLGLVHKVDGPQKATLREQPSYLSFTHKSLQEMEASKFVTQELEPSKHMKETLKEFFPSWEAASRHREVLIFVAGLVKDSRPLIQYLYEILIEHCLNEIRTGGTLPLIDVDLLKSLFEESTVNLPYHPLHNSYINWYDHMEDDLRKRPRDTTPIYSPSKLYVFDHMREVIVLEDHSTYTADIPECTLYIDRPDDAARDNILEICSEIWRHQAVSNLHMLKVTCEDPTTEGLRIVNPQILELCQCVFPEHFIRTLLLSLVSSSDSLQYLRLADMNLKPYEPLLDELLDDIVPHHEAGRVQNNLVLRLFDKNLSEEFVLKWTRRCGAIPSIDCEIYRSDMSTPSDRKRSHTKALDDAYEKACTAGSKEVFLARMNLVGFHEAGKTSLAKRLMGKDFDEKEKSTEGIAIHYITSTFNKRTSSGESWEETEHDGNELNKSVVDEMRRHWENKARKEQYLTDQKDGDQRTFRKAENLPAQKKTEIPAEEAMNTNMDIEIKPRQEFDTSLATEQRNLWEARKSVSKKIKMNMVFNEFALSHLESPVVEARADRTPFTIRLWDLGGQNDFINTHHLFLDTNATTLIVMDVTKQLRFPFAGEIKYGNPKTPAEVLCYWLNLFRIQSVSSQNRPEIAVVLTHTDMLKSTEREQIIQNYKDEIMKTVQGKQYSDLISEENIYAVDNRSSSENDFQNLKNQLLQKLFHQESWGKKIPTKWLKLEADILEGKNRKLKWIHLNHLNKMAASVGMETEDVKSFLEMHNNLGNFIHFSDSLLKHIIITDPQWLVDMCKAVITHYDFLEERNISASAVEQLKKGFVTKESLIELWDEKEIEFPTNLMLKFNLFLPVEDEKCDKKYFIPCMLPSHNMYEAEHYRNMVCLFSTSYTVEIGDKLLVGTFHKILSLCSNKSHWTLTTKCPLSYSDASLITRDGLRMEMSLQSRSDTEIEIRANIWCDQDALANDLTLNILQSRKILNKNMRMMNISQAGCFVVLCPNYTRSDEYQCMVEATERYKDWVSLCEGQNPCLCHNKATDSVGYTWRIKSLYDPDVKDLTTLSSAVLQRDGRKVEFVDVSAERRQASMEHEAENTQIYPVMFYKNCKQYYATVTDGKAVTLKSPDSEITLEIAEGLKAVVMQHIHTDFAAACKSIPSHECLVSPVVRFIVLNGNHQESEELTFKAKIPHCLLEGYDFSFLKVRCGSLKKKKSLKEIQRGKPDSSNIPYFQVDKKYITLYTNHFCDVVGTTGKKICNSSLVILPFGKLYPDRDDNQTTAKVKVFVCSYLFNRLDVRMNLVRRMQEIQLEMLEIKKMTIDVDDFDPNNSEVTLSVFPKMDKWETWTGNTVKKKLRELVEISAEGHLCRSQEPKYDPTFALMNEKLKSSFYAVLEVILRAGPVPKPNQAEAAKPIKDTEEKIPIVIPPGKDSVSQMSVSVQQEDQTRLTDAELTLIATKISPNNMKTFALLYLGIDSTQIENMKDSQPGDPEGFKREILKTWINRYQGPNAKQDLDKKLQAAQEKGLLNYDEVKNYREEAMNNLK